ncbi:MAG: hypothetical protein EPN93_00670 [Spirochaetes bacterium]|nr:MAG: hypothetical protein EPN93_00670 [Spirochaetota bacterium]
MPVRPRTSPRVSAAGRLAIVLLAAACSLPHLSCMSFWKSIYKTLKGSRTVEEVLADIGPGAEARLLRRFTDAGEAYPPDGAYLVAYKQERVLELWARGPIRTTLVHTYTVTAASGTLGPKLREGDLQVPEGIYGVMELEPNSDYYLGLKLDYPNSTDLANARADGRTNPGSDIYIHGRDYSEGCLAVGDRAIEELFTLAARTGPGKIKVIIGPQRFENGIPVRSGLPGWTEALYAEIERAIRDAGLTERGGRVRP